jgi:hypothetical protein
LLLSAAAEVVVRSVRGRKHAATECNNYSSQPLLSGIRSCHREL